MMNPRTHPRGARPDFTLPKPNPNPSRMTDALWWLVCMREALEPASQNSGTFANKPGSHNAGENLPDHGQGSKKTDHSIRDSFNRTGKWWRKYTSAHDWTFPDAQRGDYRTINRYTGRLIRSMRDPNDLRPDDVYFYTLGQIDADRVVEGYNERDDADQTGDDSHLWHRHDSFRRNIIGSFPHMWKALTIDMGWTYAEWQRSVTTEEDELNDADKKWLTGEITRLVDARADQLMTELDARLKAVPAALLAAKTGDKAVPARNVGDVLRDVSKLRGYLVGDLPDTKNAAIPVTAPVARVVEAADKIVATPES